MDITLEWHEAAMASDAGRMRHLASIKAGRRDNHGFDGLGWSEHIEGACGEMAVAKALGVYWDGSVDSFSREDLPGGVQVRTRSKTFYDLIIRPKDSDGASFVLVTGKCPSYKIHGWIRGQDAKKPEYMKDYGDRPDAYFVPQSALSPIESLKKG